MPSAFAVANKRNTEELERLQQLVRNLQTLNRIGNNQNKWRRLSNGNKHRLHNLSMKRKSHPNQYTKLNNKIKGVSGRITTRKFYYGYGPHARSNWVMKKGFMVPPNLPNEEVLPFRRFVRGGRLGEPIVVKPGTVLAHTGRPGTFPATFKFGSKWRNIFTKEKTLRPLVYTARPRPVPAKVPPRGFLPTLKRLAWESPGMAPMRTMTKEQLAFLGSLTGTNWNYMKPKPFPQALSPKTLTKYRRNLAARTIQRALKRHRAKK
jgi:hypothetical protein